MAKFSAPAGAARLRRTRACSATAPSVPTSSGFSSTSAICDTSMSSCDNPTSTRCSAAASAAGVSPRARSAAAMPLRCSSARASGTFSGGSATVGSPAPASQITGPNEASMRAPALSVRACAGWVIASTLKPARRASGSARCRPTRRRCAASRTCTALRRSRRMPPNSKPAATSGETIFSATG